MSFLLLQNTGRSLPWLACVAAVPSGGDDAHFAALPRVLAPDYEVVSEEPAVRAGLPAPPDPGDALCAEGFDALDRERWIDASLAGGPLTEGRAPALRHLPESEGAQGVVSLAARRGTLLGAFDV